MTLFLYTQAPVADRKARYSTNRLQFYYRQDGYLRWIDLPKLPPLPVSITEYAMVGVGSKLYAAGGRQMHEDRVYNADGSFRYHQLSESVFHVYDSDQNSWFPLQSMSKARHSLALVHLEGFIYAIGGQNSLSILPLHDLQRYDIVNQCWLDLAPMPAGCHKISAVTFKNKILIFGVTGYDHVLMMYSPASDKWDVLEAGNVEAEIGVNVTDDLIPILIIHRNQCYKILYKYITGILTRGYIKVVSVNVLNFGKQDVSDEVGVGTTTTYVDDLKVEDVEEELTVTIGEEIRQDFIPRDCGAFRIDDEVFMIMKGFAYKTDVRISPEQSANVDLHTVIWAKFHNYELYASNVTYLRFDKKKLQSGTKVVGLGPPLFL